MMEYNIPHSKLKRGVGYGEIIETLFRSSGFSDG